MFQGVKSNFENVFSDYYYPDSLKNVEKYVYRLQIKALHISFAGIYKVQPFVLPYYRPGCFSIKTRPPELVSFANSGPEITRKLNFLKDLVNCSHL